MSHPEFWKTTRWLIFFVSLIILGWLGTRLIERSLSGTASGIDRSLDKVLSALTHSETHIVEGRAEIESRHNIHELALIELKMSATRRFENESYVLKYLPAGTKHLIAKGRYRVTAGYKLKPGVSLQIIDGTPVAQFPEPEILSVELIDFQILSEKDGWANHITADDRSQLLRQLRQQMRVEAKESGVLDMTKSTLHTRLKDLMGTDQVQLKHDLTTNN